NHSASMRSEQLSLMVASFPHGSSSSCAQALAAHAASWRWTGSNMRRHDAIAGCAEAGQGSTRSGGEERCGFPARGAAPAPGMTSQNYAGWYEPVEGLQRRVLLGTLLFHANIFMPCARPRTRTARHRESVC